MRVGKGPPQAVENAKGCLVTASAAGVPTPKGFVILIFREPSFLSGKIDHINPKILCIKLNKNALEVCIGE